MDPVQRARDERMNAARDRLYASNNWDAPTGARRGHSISTRGREFVYNSKTGEYEDMTQDVRTDNRAFRDAWRAQPAEARKGKTAQDKWNWAFDQQYKHDGSKAGDDFEYKDEEYDPSTYKAKSEADRKARPEAYEAEAAAHKAQWEAGAGDRRQAAYEASLKDSKRAEADKLRAERQAAVWGARRKDSQRWAQKFEGLLSDEETKDTSFGQDLGKAAADVVTEGAKLATGKFFGAGGEDLPDAAGVAAENPEAMAALASDARVKRFIKVLSRRFV